VTNSEDVTPPPDLDAAADPVAARAAALELLGAYTAGLPHDERVACLNRVVGELGGRRAVCALVEALAEYGATFADLATARLPGGGSDGWGGDRPSGRSGRPDAAALVRSLARVDLT